MWRLLLCNQSPHIESFATFLSDRQPVKVINRDQWQSFLEFATTVSEDFHDYDEMSACMYQRCTSYFMFDCSNTCIGPVLFDEFVEWKREQLNAMQN